MLKKTLLTLTLALGLVAFGSSLAQAQTAGPIPPEVLAALAKEPPISQADLDAYLKALPQMLKAMTDEAAAAEMLKTAGMTDMRFSYVAAKINLAMNLAAGATPEQLGMSQIPDVIKPTQAEQDLVKKNLPALQKGVEEMTKAMMGGAQ